MNKFGDVYCVKDEVDTAFIEFQQMDENWDKNSVLFQIGQEPNVVLVQSYRESLLTRGND